MTLFNKLRDIRKEKKISAVKLANMLGLETKTAYYKKENGTVKFSLEEARTLSLYFKKSIECLFYEECDSEIDTKRDDALEEAI